MKTSQDANKNQLGEPQKLQMRGVEPPLQPNKKQMHSQPRPEDSHIGSRTIFRAANFFVHAARNNSPHSQTGKTSLLERVRWASSLREHVLEAQTRLLPNTKLINPVLHREFAVPVWIETIVVLLILSIGAVFHGWGMNTFPAYQQSEGLLMSNAWAVTHGMIQPYAYTYNQTFLGWMQIAGWLRITGGPATFGDAINSGRAMMLVLFTASSLLVYLIANRLSHSRSTGLLALTIFAFSPLAITYQREVSLDTIGTFWLLLTLYLLVASDSRLQHIVLASITFGIAILTKGIFIVFFPVMLYAVWLHVTAFQRKFALVVFIFILFSIVSTFVLFAVLKGELLPTGLLPWDHHQHPSLWEGLMADIQSAQKGSDFGSTWHMWIPSELLFFTASAVAAGINLFAGWRSPLRPFLALLLISFWAFILITGIIFTSYLVIFFPLMALNVAVAFTALLKWSKNHLSLDLARVILIFGLISILIPYRVQHTQSLTAQNVTNAQTSISTLNWIRSHVRENSTIIIDSYLYADLHESEGPTGKVYPRAHIYWNVVLDPDVRFNVLHDNWNKIDYIILDQQMQNDIRNRPSDTFLIDQALHHATLVQTFDDANHDPSAAVQIYRIEHSTI